MRSNGRRIWSDRPPTDGHFRTTFPISHNLSSHPMLQLDAIAELGADMSSEHVEKQVDEAPEILGFDHTRDPAPPDVAADIRNIAGSDRIVYLDHIETVDRYRVLVEDLSHDVVAMLGVGESTITRREGYMFISGGPSRTPAHVDHELNALLILEGTKRVWLSDSGDHEAELALEALHAGKYGSCGARPASLQAYDVHAGQGIFIAPRAAHLIENHPGRCVAFSITLRSSALDRESSVYRLNSRLRALGLSPRPPTESTVVDSAKVAVDRIATGALGRVRSSVAKVRSRT